MTLQMKSQSIQSSRVTRFPRPCKTSSQAGLITDLSQALVTPEAVSETHLLPASLNRLDTSGHLAFSSLYQLQSTTKHTK